MKACPVRFAVVGFAVFTNCFKDDERNEVSLQEILFEVLGGVFGQVEDQ